MNDISISFSKPEGNSAISIVHVSGFIDTTTSSELEKGIKQLLREQRFDIIIDLADVDYVSSAGWGIFISEIKKIRENGGDLKLASMVGDVYEVFELLEFQTILESYDNVEEAVASFGNIPEKEKETTGSTKII
ncbi:STAS domain-containing protein [bacterium]|nr:STAS domain-containing protein [bacterium]